MIEIGAFQTQRALLAFKPYKISLIQLPSTLSAGRGGAAQHKHDQVLTRFGAGHASILHLRQEAFHRNSSPGAAAQTQLLVTI